MTSILSALRHPRVYRRVRKRFQDEIRVLGGRHEATSSRTSILHFTVERAASRFVGDLMHSLATDAGMTPIDLDSYFFELGRIDKWIQRRGGPEASFYKSRGYCFGPFRTSNRHLLRRDGFRVLLSLRDPRDVLVSLYHNYAYEPAPAALASASRRRRRARKAGAFQTQRIDDFVLQFFRAGSHIRRTYEAYCEHLVGRPDVLFVRYEDMVTDFHTWLDRVVLFFELEPTSEAVRKIRHETSFEPSEDGPKRQVRPGEHLRVLEPDTVRELNSLCRDVLDCLGYDEHRARFGVGA